MKWCWGFSFTLLGHKYGILGSFLHFQRVYFGNCNSQVCLQAASQSGLCIPTWVEWASWCIFSTGIHVEWNIYHFWVIIHQRCHFDQCLHPKTMTTKLYNILYGYNTYNLIIWGDFNYVLNITLDRSSNRTQFTKSAKINKDFISKNGLSNIWRFKFPDKKYSLSSPVTIIHIPVLIMSF